MTPDPDRTDIGPSVAATPPQAPPEVGRPARMAPSLLIGLALVVLINVAAPAMLWRYFTPVGDRSEITRTFLPTCVMLPFLLLVFAVNPLLKSMWRSWALRPGELAMIFAMALTGSSIPIFLLGMGIGIVSSPYYFATPENQWVEKLWPYLPRWLTPSNDTGAMAFFYEGLPPGRSVPWAAWTVPLFWWFSFIVAFYAVCFSLVVIFRRHWVEHERLPFPIVELPQRLIEDSDGPRLVPALLRERSFWIGFSITAVIWWMSVAHEYFPALPGIPVWWVPITLARGFPALMLWIYPPVLGIMFLAHLDVLLSLWFFAVMVAIQEGIYSRFGFSLGLSSGFIRSVEASAWQSWGAFVVLVLTSFWLARRHLWTVLRKAIRPDRVPIDDTLEPMSYRTAVLVLVGGLLFMMGWFRYSGLSWPLVFAFTASVITIYFGLTRILCQVGLLYATPPMLGEVFLFHAVGTANMAPQSAVSLGYQYIWHSDVQTIFMGHAATGTRITEQFRRQMRILPRALLLSTVAGLVATAAYILWIGYHGGAFNFGSWSYSIGGKRAFGETLAQIKDQSTTHWPRMGFMGLGAAMMGIVTFLRYRFAWWPLHPVGLAVASTSPMRYTMLAIFLAWLSKLVILRLGGGPLYERAKPFFFGLAIGYFAGDGFPLILDMALWPEGPNVG